MKRNQPKNKPDYKTSLGPCFGASWKPSKKKPRPNITENRDFPAAKFYLGKFWDLRSLH